MGNSLDKALPSFLSLKKPLIKLYLSIAGFKITLYPVIN